MKNTSKAFFQINNNYSVAESDFSIFNANFVPSFNLLKNVS